MASVWKRLQRVNKRAAKFQYTASYHRIDLETTPKWKPNKLSVVWTRRSRRVVTEPLEWEPSLKDPLKGSVIFPLPENHTVAVTLFRDPRTNELEDKDWTFVLEDVSSTGKRRRLASLPLNLRPLASLPPASRALGLQLVPGTNKILAASLHLTLHSVLLREGRATDEDMQSLASLLSVNNNSDIAVLEDLDEDDYTLSDRSSKQVLDLRQQMEELTNSLTSSDLAATPNTPDSVQSLNYDNSRTPTAPQSPTTPTPDKSDRTPTALNPTFNSNPTFNPAPNSTFNPSLPKSQMDYDHSFGAISPREQYNYTPKQDNNTYNNFNASTPFKPEMMPDPNYKSFMFKPKAITKMSLKPLDLKTNLNNIGLDGKWEKDKINDSKSPEETPVDEKLFIGRIDKNKTPVQDLLEWCQSVTSDYPSCNVTNLTTSFTNGLAFCAIIHHFRPDLIDYSGLQSEDATNNLRTAFSASAALGLAPLLAGDVRGPRGPDRLAIMTYLFQMRAHFTGGELQVEQLGNDETESSYLVGRHDTDSRCDSDLFSREVVARRSQRISNKAETPSSKTSSRTTPERVKSPKETKDIMNSNSFIGKVLSPNKELRPLSVSTTKWFTDPLLISAEPPPKPERLMTRKELTDPFGSDEEDEQDHNGIPEKENKLQTPSPERERDREHRLSTPEEEPGSPSELPKPTPQMLSRHDELKERARQLLEATKREAREKDRNRRQNSKEKEDSPMTEEERQAMLRERARKLIANARAGIVSPTSPTQTGGRVEIISQQSVLDEALAGSIQKSSPTRSLGSQPSPDRTERAPLRSFAALVARLSPDHADDNESKESGSYIQSEQSALEKEQAAVDARAAALERQLRAVMAAGRDAEEEDRLLAQWFNLVNKKNALLRRQMQLNILEQEEDLSRRCELLARELRLSLAVDEWRKSPDQKRRERLLLQELLEAVNERDRLVQEMDEQEKAIADDDEIARDLSQVELQRKNNCILQ